MAKNTSDNLYYVAKEKSEGENSDRSTKPKRTFSSLREFAILRILIKGVGNGKRGVERKT
jgi:hypothetical protein